MEVQRGQFWIHTFKLDVCSSLTLMHERYANMADLVKLRTKVSEVIFNKLLVMIFLCLRRKHNPLSMHSTHGSFSRCIKFNVNKALVLH